MITPTGISAGAMATLATVSQIAKNAPPKTMVTGMSLRCSHPTKSRQICGAIMPMKPMGPHTDTTPHTMMEAEKNTRFFVLPTLTPRLVAMSSPVDMRLKSWDRL